MNKKNMTQLEKLSPSTQESAKKVAIQFYDWIISEDGKDIIHDMKIFGEINQEPSGAELFQLFLEYKK